MPIAFSGKKNEYDEALEFFETLKKLLPDHVPFLVVQGNHDVDRSKLNDFLSMHTIVTDGKTRKFLESQKDIDTFVNSKCSPSE